MTSFAGKLLPTQYDFVNDFDYRELAFIGGYGAGKSQSAACKAIKLAALNKGFSGAILSPTFSMLKDTLIPTFEDTLISMGVKYTYKATPQPSFILHWKKGNSKVFCRSAENYRRLASLNLSWAIVDEADLIDPDTCILMWKMLQSRLRVGYRRQLCATTTPEGFGGMYRIFVKDDKPYRNRYHAKTTENYHLPQDYIENLYSSYSPQEIEAYVNGQFCNLKSGTVYHGFDRKANHTDETAESLVKEKGKTTLKPVLHIGCDFNVGQTTGIVCCVVGGIVYVVDEITELRDTEQLIEVIKQRYPTHQIVMYPDSSGKNTSTATTITDITLLKKAFGPQNVKYPNSNPRIMNRVKALNARILNGKDERRLLVNTNRCPTITSCLEQQAYDKNGKPEKVNNVDHPLDALGYCVHYLYPITSRATLRNI